MKESRKLNIFEIRMSCRKFFVNDKNDNPGYSCFQGRMARSFLVGPFCLSLGREGST
jgi:hypothetical protein